MALAEITGTATDLQVDDNIEFNNDTYTVLDEATRAVGGGFHVQLERIENGATYIAFFPTAATIDITRWIA